MDEVTKRIANFNLNELARKLSLNIFTGNAKVKTPSIVKRKFQIWQLVFFPVLVCQVMYSCQFKMK